MSVSTPPNLAVDSPAWAPVASTLAVPPITPSVGDSLSKYLIAQQLPCFEENSLCLAPRRPGLHLGNWKSQDKLCFAKHEPNAIHQLGLLKIVHFKSLHKFLNTFQKTANKALKQTLRNNSSSDCKTTVENFHSLVSICAFLNALTHSYSAMVQAAEPNLLEDAIALVRDKYDIWVEQATAEHTKENLEWNPFALVCKQNKSEEISQEVKAHLEDLNCRFDAMLMVQEQGRQPNPTPSCTYQRDCNHLYNPCCYNCSELGHISKDCTAPCSICKEPSHSNFISEFNLINHDRKPQGLMMAEQNFEAGKRALSSSATPQPLNKKSNLEYTVDPDGPSFPFTLICKCQVCSQGPSSGCKLTPPPMKRTDCKDAPFSSVFLPHIHDETVEDLENPSNPDPPCKPPSSPLPPRMYGRNSNLENEDVFKNKDHYLCLPDLDKYLPFKDNPHYNIVTVESVPKSPHTNGRFYDLPSDTPSLEASPTGTAAWGHRATRQEGKDKGPAAFGSHHCSHPGQRGSAMVSQVNSPGFGPARSLNTVEMDRQGLLADPADLEEPIRSACGNKFNVHSALYNVDISNQPIISWAHWDTKGPAALLYSCNLNQPIKLHVFQGARGQHTSYNPCNLGHLIKSSYATCNSMHMAPSESSNLTKPITPDNAMEVDSDNILTNNCNLNGPITHNNAMENDSPNVSYMNFNLNEPIRPHNTIETDTPNVLSNNCNSDGPIRSGTADANYTHTDQAGCPTSSQPIRPCVAKETNAPNVLHYYCNTDEPIRSRASGANYTHTILSQSIRYKKDPNWTN
ncbi:hypothetical protein DSO57_1003067 [Entomophthora muscae]|uniref:Uncharacterized protein n=1 Tax=Entomophthora muscae TaxID=34485 RepID=A0ACC2TJK5_9FUNG|nr:hypothetical protein DSO57_1003067 [Entomophthora muscae]